MNKTEITAVVVLFAMLIGWGYVQKKYLTPPPAPKKIQSAIVGGTNNAEMPVTPDRAAGNQVNPAPVKQAELKAAGTNETEEGHSLQEKTVVLSTDLMDVRVSSWGGGIVSVDLKKYKATIKEDSGPVTLDFSSKPALSLTGIPGLSTNNDYTVTLAGDGKTISVERTTKDGLCLKRTISVTNSYGLQVTDVLSNSSPAELTLPTYGVALGPMRETGSAGRGMYNLGLDTLPAHGGEPLKYWASSLPGLFGVSSSFGCARQSAVGMPPSIDKRLDSPVAWAAAKNKFFVQILVPSLSATDCELHAERDMTASSLVVSNVSVNVLFAEEPLQPGDTLENTISYYVGPKDYAVLKPLGNHEVDVMEFGKWFGWLCPPLLVTMKWLFKVIPNYGVDVILLTCIVRFILWPITRKATQSMKEMQKVQPLVNELREKYKDKPQKLNQEIMALYKEHKVNPMAGCLPIVLQIPVFFALFTMLRSAVELRYSHFLWIKDLSEPERLFAGSALLKVFPLSIAGSINILPLLMTATAIWQQKLTPTAGDPQQQKMMAIMMPAMFLVMFYNMASALVLYWTVSQLLSIAGMMWQQRVSAQTEAVSS